ASVEIAQDRMREKAFARDCGLQVAPYIEVHRRSDLDAADPALFPAILKAARLGYDGKGQARVADREQAHLAFERIGAVPCVLEKMLSLDLEVSALVARGFDGNAVVYPLAENVHRDGILSHSTVPARVSQDLAWRATDAALRIAHALDYVGVLCVEFFVLADSTLLFNEMAPRPHNSGHYSIDACVTSQFEQQARILARLPLGSVHQHEPAVMLNLLGDLWFDGASGASGATRREPDWARALRHPRVKLHLYGKSQARRGRKMGHVTVLDETVERATHVAGEVARDLGVV
ncbi:MAG: 5-(carboxyamino)imidazole ribonucleotide synthase, partial [Burkholderiaceae bacterium]|nr:5-(carboxyamino)imidazole ribonucleotide synthase [Burkholderiaceae bacterium]